MKILLTGSLGYMGQFLHRILADLDYIAWMNNKERIEVEHINFIDENSVEKLKVRSPYDFIFHCAVSGGRSFSLDSEKTYYENIHMYNLVSEIPHDVFIHFTSAADSDRRLSLSEISTDYFLNASPNDYFGKSKNHISLKVRESAGINLRVFNVFGNPGIRKNQFLDNLKYALINNINFHIENDRYFDFFYIKDLIPIIDGIIHNRFRKDFNLSYPKKYLISEVASFMKELTNSESVITVTKTSALSFTGDSAGLEFYFGDLKIALKDYIL